MFCPSVESAGIRAGAGFRYIKISHSGTVFKPLPAKLPENAALSPHGRSKKIAGCVEISGGCGYCKQKTQIPRMDPEKNMTQLTERIRQQLVSDILKGRYVPGSAFPTELETAERFHASRVTVRRAYGALEEAGIIVRRRRVGTVVNDRFAAATGPARTLGAILPLNDMFSREFLETICDEAGKRGVLTVLEPGGDSGEEQNRAAFRLAAAGVRSIVMWGLDRRLDFDLFRRLRVLGVNQVFFDRIFPGNFADYVGLDNRAALETLIDCAEKDGAGDFIFLDAAGLDVDSQRERRESFIAVCRKRKLPHRILELPWREVARETGNYGCGDFFRALSPKRSAALIGGNGQLAHVLTGRVPANCRFYTVDGGPPEITSYTQPMRSMAQACFAALDRQRKAGARWTARDYRLPGELHRPAR